MDIQIIQKSHHPEEQKFYPRDTAQYKEQQKQVEKENKLIQISYEDKVSHMLSSGNSSPAWKDMKLTMGQAWLWPIMSSI